MSDKLHTLVNAVNQLEEAVNDLNKILVEIVLTDDDAEYTKAFEYMTKPHVSECVTTLNERVIEFLNLGL